MRLTSFLVIAILVAVVAACSDGDEGGDGDQLRVITSLPLFADMASEVGGDRVAVSALLPKGADPHTWEPVPQDAVRIEEAEIVFVNGLDLDPSALTVIDANVGSGVPIIELAEESGAEVLEGAEPHEGEDGDEHAEGDPHLWMNPLNGIVYAAVIRDHLSEVDPEGSADYAANFEGYQTKIEEANAYLEEASQQVPEENRKLVITHDAFGYLADHIGFEITAFVVAGPGQDASPDDIQAVVEAVEEQGVPAVFSEPQIDSESETLKQVAADTDAMICTLYSDSLDDEVSTYIDMIRFNADELERCLGGAGGD